MSKYRLTTLYACLVGLPLFGLAGLLRAGQGLVAPVSIGGAWKVEADFSELAATPCAALLSTVKQPTLAVAQSGRRVLATFNNLEQTVLPGILQDMMLTMGQTSDQTHSKTASCQEALYLDAIVTRDEPRILAGTLGVRCPGCPSIPFRAVRQRQTGTDTP